MTGAASGYDQDALSTPLVGRDTELEQLRSALRETQRGMSQFVLVSGEAGIGKTTLVERLRQEAAREGILTMTGYCRDLGTPPPYAPWDDLLSRQRFAGDARLRSTAAA